MRVDDSMQFFDRNGMPNRVNSPMFIEKHDVSCCSKDDFHTDDPLHDVVDEADIELTCIDCWCVFAFTVGEQRFFAERSFPPPKRCKPCRATRKQQLHTGD
jgi:hypothetical protein